jgi:predicted molibdopterin-dependent oxidoreductase YjgC
MENSFMSIQITLNGKYLLAEEGQTILQVARQNNINIPTLCYHKDLSPTGNCRMCVVEVKNWRFLQAACVTQVIDAMEIFTNSEKVNISRKLSLQLMLANHPQDCITCEASGECELQDLAYEYKVEAPSWGSKGSRYPVDSDPNPFIRVDMNRCILCRRCVLACSEIQVRNVWGVAKRGIDEQIVAGADTTLIEARCESCGQCVAYCPTGALSNKISYAKGRRHQVKKIPTICTYCGVGCQFDFNVVNNRIIGVSSKPGSPVNEMALCVKGRYGWDFIYHPDRQLKPKVRRYLLDKKLKPAKYDPEAIEWNWVETDWDTAFNITAKKLSQFKNTYGPNSIGIFTSAKCTNEENYLMNKFSRQVIGTNNIDHCARL